MSLPSQNRKEEKSEESKERVRRRVGPLSNEATVKSLKQAVCYEFCKEK